MNLSVVVPAHGRRALVEATLSSLARQEGPFAFRVVLVEDGADPGLGEHLRRLGLPLELDLVCMAENRGRAAARNSGIERARGDIVVFLDSDMEVGPGFVAAHARAHEGEDTVVLGAVRTAPAASAGAFARYMDSRGVEKLPPGAPIPARYFTTGNASVSRALLARAGGFDEDFDEYGGEDTEMGYRLAAAGGRFRHARDALALHLDLGSVPRMARRLRRYGQTMLPLLVEKAPAAREELGLDLAEAFDFREDGVRGLLEKIACRCVCRRTFWAPAAAIGQVLPRWWPAHPLYDFVRAAAYLDGYRAALRASR